MRPPTAARGHDHVGRIPLSFHRHADHSKGDDVDETTSFSRCVSAVVFHLVRAFGT
jgi:hypothetical protein